jgi:putative transposase
LNLFEFIHAEKAHFGVGELCRNLGVSRSGYHAWATRPKAQRERDDELLRVEIRAIHKASRRRYGSPRVHAELKSSGRCVSRKRVARLMRDDGLQACPKRRFTRTTLSEHNDPIAPNVLGRDFTASQPNQVWVGDITYIWTSTGWCYLAVLLDLYSRRVVGWALRPSLGREVAIAALSQALSQRNVPRGLIHHTDRGCQYASDEYRALLRARGVVRSMSRAGDCWDNAVSESFFATLKKELVHRRVFATHTEAYDAVRDYIDGFYNGVRRHSTIGYHSPVEFENLHRVAQAA